MTLYCTYWIRFVLDWPMREQPGTRWEYISGGVILLGASVGEAVGERIDLFGDRELFASLGLVMVSTAENGDTPNAGRPIDFLYTHVLASVRH